MPAMLSPGEFVVNVQASRNFYAQLTAINAGSRTPASTPNITNNSTVGDIHVNVPYGTPSAMVRQIADMLQRETRRRN